MSYTVIKKVERETIVLEEINIQQFTTRSLTYAIINFFVWAIIGVGISYFVITVIASGDTNYSLIPKDLIIPVTGLMGGIVGSLFFTAIGAFHEPVPAYSVKILGKSNNTHIIQKITPTKDQVEICRVAKKLETEARSISRKERELEQIAQNCNNEV